MVNWLVTDEFSARTGGLFKPEFVGALEVYCADSQVLLVGKNDTKYSCKGMSKEAKRNDLGAVHGRLERKLDTGKNTGFRVHDQGMITYEQNKLGLSAYYDKRYVLRDGIHTRPL